MLPDRCVVKLRPPGTPVSCVVVIQYYGAQPVANHYYDGRMSPDRCVVKMRPPGTPVPRTVAIQSYGAANTKESLLRWPHVAGSLCSENVSSRRAISYKKFTVEHIPSMPRYAPASNRVQIIKF